MDYSIRSLALKENIRTGIAYPVYDFNREKVIAVAGTEGGETRSYTISTSTELDSLITETNNWIGNVVVHFAAGTYNPTVGFNNVVGTLTLIADANYVDIVTTDVSGGTFIQSCSAVYFRNQIFRFSGENGLEIKDSTVSINRQFYVIGDDGANWVALQITDSTFNAYQKVILQNDALLYAEHSELNFHNNLDITGDASSEDGMYLEHCDTYINDLTVTGFRHGVNINTGRFCVSVLGAYTLTGKIVFLGSGGGAEVYMGYVVGDMLTTVENLSFGANMNNLNDGILRYGPAYKTVADAYPITMLDGMGTLFAGSTGARTVVLDIPGPFEVSIVQVSSGAVTATITGTVVGPIATVNEGDVLRIRRLTYSGSWYSSLS